MDKKSKVIVLRCDDYDEEKIYTLLKIGLDQLGGLESFINKEEKILLKPNLLKKAEVEKAVITHPVVVGAFARILREEEYENIVLADSCGHGTTRQVIQGTGMDTCLEKYQIPAIDYTKGVHVDNPEGTQAKEFILPKELLEADCVISLSKMKTHALERITGAVKNLYGCVCGVNKAAGHASYPDRYAFAEMLADLNRCVKPRLHILDGIVAMEGNGPSSGTPTPMNVLLFSDDAVALDSVFAALVHVPPAAVPTCVAGAAAGVGEMDLEQIRVLTPGGEISVAQAVETYGRSDFDVDRSGETHGRIERLARLLPLVQTRPQVDRKRCVACGICQEACPVPGKAVKAGQGKKARYDYHKCIRCYCCQEMCPAKAISVHRGLVNRLLSGN